MRNIEVKEWNVKTPDGKNVKESLLVILTVLVTNKKPEELPKGFEHFKLFSKLVRAFEKATETNVLVLEETEYKFLKNTVVTDIPMTWAGNKDIFEAIDLFINAKEE